MELCVLIIKYNALSNKSGFRGAEIKINMGLLGLFRGD